MKTGFKFVVAATAILTAASLMAQFQPASAKVSAAQLSTLNMPSGFHMEVYAEVPGARQLARGPKGTIFVGSRENPGRVFAITTDQTGKNRVVKTIASGLLMPNGVAVLGNDLYIGEVNRILKYADIENHLDAPPKPQVVFDKFSDNAHHGWKYIRFGPDGLLYVPVGAPCNVCVPTEKFGSMTRMKPDGSGFEIIATGIRNSVGFDWDPQTRDLWFTDNGRDLLGDNIPPDELNHATATGQNFGFPYRYGQNVSDPEYGAKKPADLKTIPAAQDLAPHVAALGMRFYTGKMFPAEYQNQIFIAEHGSWNRSKPIGYRITLVRLKDGKPIKYETFMEGWLQRNWFNNDTWGRPVDLLQMPDGSMLISDDHAGLVYRLSYR